MEPRYREDVDEDIREKGVNSCEDPECAHSQGEHDQWHPVLLGCEKCGNTALLVQYCDGVVSTGCPACDETGIVPVMKFHIASKPDA